MVKNMQGKKSSKEKKRKHSHRETLDRERKRRSTESSMEICVLKDHKDVEHTEQVMDEPSDIEEGGLDLDVPFKPIRAYVPDRQEMLDQCFRVLTENKLRKMLPDELKDSSFAEIRTLCWDQLQQLPESNLLEILEGKELTANSGNEKTVTKGTSVDSQQDNSVDSTSSVKEAAEAEDKPDGSGEDSDVLSINADMDDSDIEGHKDNKPLVEEAPPTTTVTPSVTAPAAEADVQPPEPKMELQHDIDKSVSEILALTTPSPSKLELEGPLQSVVVETPPTSLPLPAATTAVPSAQQLALLELEMRARAIKALMKANELKK